MTAPDRVPVKLDGDTWHPLAPHAWPLDTLVLLEDGADGPFLAALLPDNEAAAIAAVDLDDAELYDLADRLVAELTARP